MRNLKSEIDRRLSDARRHQALLAERTIVMADGSLAPTTNAWMQDARLIAFGMVLAYEEASALCQFFERAKQHA